MLSASLTSSSTPPRGRQTRMRSRYANPVYPNPKFLTFPAEKGRARACRQVESVNHAQLATHHSGRERGSSLVSGDWCGSRSLYCMLLCSVVLFLCPPSFAHMLHHMSHQSVSIYAPLTLRSLKFNSENDELNLLPEQLPRIWYCMRGPRVSLPL